MYLRKRLCLITACIVTVSLCAVMPVAAGSDPSWPAYPGSPGGQTKFIQTDGQLLRTPDGKPFLIRGVAFGNDVWSNPQSGEGIREHGAADFARVKAMGFNTVRFYINYGLFENDSSPYVYKQGGFDWLDKNIAAARVNGIRLVLNMHFPQGGFQSNGAGDALWTDEKNRKRLSALWKEIARRYRDEEIIIGYGLVNEPVPLKGVAQWTALAQKLIDGIRSEDPAHLLFVERACWLKNGDTKEDRDNLYFPSGLIDPSPKPNIVYEYHMYDPMPFTHQNASWIDGFKGTFSSYPDPGKLVATGSKWESFTGGNPKAAPGTSGWTTLDGVPHQVTNAAYKIGRPVIQAHSIGKGGTVWVDDIVVEEYDGADNFIRTLAEDSVDGSDGWYFWSADNSGKASLADGVAGASGKKSLRITGTTGDANYGCDSLQFPVTPGNKYKISGRIKGEKIAERATVRFRVDFYSCDEVHAWDKEYLRALVGKYRAYSSAKNVPLYLGEFGAIVFAFQNDRGGITWLSDMLDILGEGNVNYNYHTYHETNFGLYMNESSIPPDPEIVNRAAIDLFTKKQN
jgi:endoglucanase